MAMPPAGEVEWESKHLVKLQNIYKTEQNLISHLDISTSTRTKMYVSRQSVNGVPVLWKCIKSVRGLSCGSAAG